MRPYTPLTDEQRKHLRWFVLGATLEHFHELHQNPDNAYAYSVENARDYAEEVLKIAQARIERGERYAEETLQLVQAHLEEGIFLDGCFSDFQCQVALEAKKLFSP